MNFSNSHFSEPYPPSAVKGACVNGRRIKLWDLIPTGIIMAVLLYELRHDAGMLAIMLLIYLAWNSYGTLVAALRPPQLAIRGGRFTFRFGSDGFSCPAADVADIHYEAQSVRLTLSDVSRIEPATVRQKMAPPDHRHGIQIGIPPGIYSLEQVNRLRTALGMPPQTADQAADQIEEFQTSVSARQSIVTICLIAACTIVYLAQAIHDRSPLGASIDSSIAWGANYAPLTMRGQWWRLVSHMFLHGGPIHILMNMWGLLYIGRLMERLVGHTALLLIYLLAGVAGGMASMAFHPHVVSVGASGAIFGLIGALFGLLLHARGVVPTSQLKQLQGGIITVVILNLLFGFSVQGIDNAAHIGGAIAGLLAGLIVVPARSPGQWLRLGILGIAGAGALILWAHFLPPPPFDDMAVIRNFSENQQAIIDAYEDIETKHLQGDLSDREFADHLQNDGGSPLAAMSEEVIPAMKEYLTKDRQEKWGKYLQLRQESFEDLLAWAQHRDDKRFGQSIKEAAAADKIAHEMNSDDEKP